MNWRIVASTFGAIFLAELGDKTQLAAITLSASTGRPLSVLVGASAALVTVTILGDLPGRIAHAHDARNGGGAQ